MTLSLPNPLPSPLPSRGNRRDGTLRTTAGWTTAGARLLQAGALLVAVNLIFTACGGSDAAEPVEDAPHEQRAEAAETESQSEGQTAAQTSDSGLSSESAVELGTAAEPETAAEGPSGPTDNAVGPDNSDHADSAGDAGEPLAFGPPAGTQLTVVGVRYDDVLNFRAEPNPQADVVATASPLASATVLALGEAWQAPNGVWWKVTIDGEEAWANQKFLGGLGSPTDLFAEVSAALGTLEFATLEEASLAVAATRASIDPEPRVVHAAEPLAFDAIGGFIVTDVLDLGDDSVKGQRLRVEVEFVFDETTGDEGAQDVVGVVLTAVKATPICGRGVADGLCV